MAEQLDLATPQIAPQLTTGFYKLVSLTIQVEQQRVSVALRGANSELLVDEVTGSAALAVMSQLNTANLAVKSLQRRCLEWVASRHPELTGAVSGTPD